MVSVILRCSLCPYESSHDESAVTTHIQEEHNGQDGVVINDLFKYKTEAEMMAKSCFLDWQLLI